MLDYIEPKEPKEKCYLFKANVIGTIEGYVWAESYEEAIELIRNKEYDEIERFDIEEVDDIEDIKEE